MYPRVDKREQIFERYRLVHYQFHGSIELIPHIPCHIPPYRDGNFSQLSTFSQFSVAAVRCFPCHLGTAQQSLIYLPRPVLHQPELLLRGCVRLTGQCLPHFPFCFAAAPARLISRLYQLRVRQTSKNTAYLKQFHRMLETIQQLQLLGKKE